MKRIEGAGWLVLALALLGVSLGPLRARSARADAPDVEVAAQPTDGTEPAERRLAAAEADTNFEDLPSIPAAGELARALRDGIRERLGRPSKGETLAQVLSNLPLEVTLHPILVHLPDPQQGRHARYFDQGVDALRRGASKRGYDQIGFVLPTPAKDEAAANGAIVEPDQYFLLFARGPSLLICLLVLESPVQGPKVGDLSTALSIAAHMEQDGDRFRLLAPFFSGAASAIGMQLERFAQEQTAPAAFDVVTGTATRRDINDEIERHPETWFRRTTPNDDAVLEFLSAELDQLHGSWRKQVLGPLQIALLAEFDTAFGGGLARQEDRAAPPGEARQGQGAAEVVAFRYPSAIAEVRHVRQRQEKAHADADGNDPLSLRRTLQLDVDFVARDPDIPPLLSQITPFERELELGEQLTGICRERYDYLILAATDPLDLVYLAEESRKYCPGLPLVALGAEKIFRHPDVRSALDGVLVAGSYPLLNETPPWGTSDERPFSSHVTQGLYNAWLTLLNEALSDPPEPLLDYRAPSSPERGHPEGCPSGEGQPLWLTVLAGGSFWPLRSGCVESTDAVKQVPAGASPPLDAPRARLGGTIRMAGLLLLAIALAQIFWMNRPELLDLRRDPLGARYRLGTNLTLFLLILLILPAMMSFPPISGHPKKRDNARGVFDVTEQESAPSEAQVRG